mmetsp:Transcript_22901/g.51137  ORF Transcript_22901/g.51137 Transcript_22901/m.51137 type:complete len:300 (-) Transcript_22901:5-904(-)|eukprot:CAMPEP_0201164880 /NCGR_PEP_ID=MMETSP0851-20130426/61508_1 /ASSEMBLY_ACC=CAM_ASM_000631 /TAXON_ID=183588 /ORGANISM="Pseudo-nitzschia fraudulenta, Strain WWA7" /LENGTH=299 /DNA_ID=CAMNT_0047445393 /DNA_START=756 /DNA_END=1655 /DNA_ORIENTATION=-
MPTISDDIKYQLDLDNSLTDVTLVGSDGGRVPALKTILALRSPVFRKMFFGNFWENGADCDAVTLDYSAEVLRAVVEYCYTDDTALQREIIHVRPSTDATAVLAVQTRGAAKYFDLPELGEGLTKSLESCSWQADFAIFQEVMVREGTGGDIWCACAERIGLAQRRHLLMPKTPENAGICGCSFPVVEALYRSDYFLLSSASAIKGLRLWNAEPGPATEDEQERLKMLVGDIDLFTNLEFECLVEIEPCQLFSAERLHEALVHAWKKKINDKAKKRAIENGKRKLHDLILGVSKKNKVN